jgi:hypothetical protein
MDNLFKTRTLTMAVNAMRSPGRLIAQKYFNPKLRGEDTPRLAFDIITGSETVLKTLRAEEPATIGVKTGRRTITMEAPRLSEKRMVHNYELIAMRAYGEQYATEKMATRIAREQFDMRNKFDRTIEFWCSQALKGKIYDSDLTTELLNFSMDADHTPSLTTTSKWNSVATGSPITDIRDWKLLIEEDSGHEITGWSAICGHKAMDALLQNTSVLELLKYQGGGTLLRDAKVINIAGVDITEYNASWKTDAGVRTRFIPAEAFVLIGEGADVFDFPYARTMDDEDPGGTGNPGAPSLFFSNSWVEKDPSGRWIKVESCPLPVVVRPDAIVYATVCD